MPLSRSVRPKNRVLMTILQREISNKPWILDSWLCNHWCWHFHCNTTFTQIFPPSSKTVTNFFRVLDNVKVGVFWGVFYFERCDPLSRQIYRNLAYMIKRAKFPLEESVIFCIVVPYLIRKTSVGYNLWPLQSVSENSSGWKTQKNR